ncbi:MAG: UDP-N-acetylmuramate:L-alanyl-gamma-D-glutamyl-meso-diaminopimelate ligase [Pseudomonadota bacterium]
MRAAEVFSLDMPARMRRVHLLGICGVAMASLAGLFRQSGFFEVTGSDDNVYPPMSDFVAALGIDVLRGFKAEHVSRAAPDLVVIGNAIRRENPEAQAVLAQGVPYLSLPEAISRFFLTDKTSLVIAGTHGKTTTSALTAWLLEAAGLKPGFMIGGIARNFSRGCRLAEGEHFVLEGDEYDTAFFDKGPKFLHYRPMLTVVTGVEFDHADIYADLDAVKESFRGLLRIIPPEGLLLAYSGCPNLRGLLSEARCRVQIYGSSDDAEWRAVGQEFGQGGTSFELRRGEHFSFGRFNSPLHGLHNLHNTVAAMALAMHAGADTERLREGLKGFEGVARRQEVKGEIGGITLIEDFAHHPTAVRETLAALKAAYGDRRLLCAFEPRTNSSRRNIFQAEYSRSFGAADVCLIREAPGLDKIPDAERFSSRRLTEDLRAAGTPAHFFADTEALVGYLAGESRPGDVIVTMSNGGFDDIQGRLAVALRRRFDPGLPPVEPGT